MAWENNRPTHVPSNIRTACLQRDGYQCTATLRNGTRCTETTSLEAAHLTQWHPGERTTVDMVTTLCHWHHNRETQQQAAQARKRNTKHGTHLHPREQHPGLR